MATTTKCSGWVGLTLTVVLLGCSPPEGEQGEEEDEIETVQQAITDCTTKTSLPNNQPIKNENGSAATFSTQGKVSLTGAFFTPQGTNGRHCGSCHTVADGWSISSRTLKQIFDKTKGLDPVFNLLDADRPDAFPSNEALRSAPVKERRAVFTMLLQGKFSRRITPPSTPSTEFDVIETQDPFGVSTPTSLWFFRRALPTANLRSFRVNFDNSNGSGTDLHAGLGNQARGNIRNAQQNPLPVSEQIIEEIVSFEKALSHAQVSLGDLRLDKGGAKGGPENFSQQPFVPGPFTLFDAWAGNKNRLKAQIARGQALFNNAKPGRPACLGCHNAANDGQSTASIMFDIQTSSCDLARPDMAKFILRNRSTGAEVCTTDPGRAVRSGLWADLNRFDMPSLRGVGSRGEYFHNGIAHTLKEVVLHYERKLGFSFTRQEREDLVAFMKAL